MRHLTVRVVLAALAGVLLVGAPAPLTPAASAATCADAGGVSVLVDFRELGGGVRTDCVAGGGQTANTLTAAAGNTIAFVQRQPGFVCRINGVPADDPCVNTPPSTAYWGLYWSDGTSSQWTYASLGGSALKVPAGGSLAWAWQGATKGAPGVPAPVTAAPTTPTATSTPTTETTAPTPTTSPSAPSTGGAGPGGGKGNGGKGEGGKPGQGDKPGRGDQGGQTPSSSPTPTPTTPGTTTATPTPTTDPGETSGAKDGGRDGGAKDKKDKTDGPYEAGSSEIEEATTPSAPAGSTGAPGTDQAAQTGTDAAPAEDGGGVPLSVTLGVLVLLGVVGAAVAVLRRRGEA